LGTWQIAIALTVVVALLVTILASVYWLNQMAVRTELEPRREERETLLASLKDGGEKETATGTATSC
jgi:Tfp pilus assembly protein PilO